VRTNEWHAITLAMDHPTHGRFFIGIIYGETSVSAQRSWHVGDVCHCEWIGEPGQTHANVDAAKAAVAKRIAELDALAVPELLEAGQ